MNLLFMDAGSIFNSAGVVVFVCCGATNIELRWSSFLPKKPKILAAKSTDKLTIPAELNVGSHRNYRNSTIL